MRQSSVQVKHQVLVQGPVCDYSVFTVLCSGLAQEAAPLVDRARSAGLGLYGHYLRPKIGEPLDKAINHIKTYLDQYLPVAEE